MIRSFLVCVVLDEVLLVCVLICVRCVLSLVMCDLVIVIVLGDSGVGGVNVKVVMGVVVGVVCKVEGVEVVVLVGRIRCCVGFYCVSVQVISVVFRMNVNRVMISVVCRGCVCCFIGLL